MKKKINNKDVRKDIRALRKERSVFIKESYSAKEIKKLLSLTDDDLSKIKKIFKHDKERYLKKDILDYIKYGSLM